MIAGLPRSRAQRFSARRFDEFAPAWGHPPGTVCTAGVERRRRGRAEEGVTMATAAPLPPTDGPRPASAVGLAIGRRWPDEAAALRWRRYRVQVISSGRHGFVRSARRAGNGAMRQVPGLGFAVMVGKPAEPNRARLHAVGHPPGLLSRPCGRRNIRPTATISPTPSKAGFVLLGGVEDHEVHDRGQMPQHPGRTGRRR